MGEMNVCRFTSIHDFSQVFFAKGQDQFSARSGGKSSLNFGKKIIQFMQKARVCNFFELVDHDEQRLFCFCLPVLPMFTELGGVSVRIQAKYLTK